MYKERCNFLFKTSHVSQHLRLFKIIDKVVPDEIQKLTKNASVKC